MSSVINKAWSLAHDIAVLATGLDPRKSNSARWKEVDKSRWRLALDAAERAIEQERRNWLDSSSSVVAFMQEKGTSHTTIEIVKSGIRALIGQRNSRPL